MNGHLMPSDFYKVFDLMSENPNPDVKELQKLLTTSSGRKPNRITVSRLKNVVSRIMEHGSKPLADEEVQRIADNSGYGATLTYVQKAHSNYIVWLARKALEDSTNKNWQDHLDEISTAARELAESLKANYWPYTYTSKQVIAEDAVDYDNTDLVSLLNSLQIKWLFSHVKDEFPQLSGLTRWDDLRVCDIDENLVDTLIKKAARREFQGDCEICEGGFQE